MIVKSLIIYTPPAGHVITGNLNVIPDASVPNIISKGRKYRFLSNIEFPKCPREIAASLKTGPSSAVRNMSGNRCESAADPGVASSILARFHTFEEIDHE